MTGITTYTMMLSMGVHVFVPWSLRTKMGSRRLFRRDPSVAAFVGCSYMVLESRPRSFYQACEHALLRVGDNMVGRVAPFVEGRVPFATEAHLKELRDAIDSFLGSTKRGLEVYDNVLARFGGRRLTVQAVSELVRLARAGRLEDQLVNQLANEAGSTNDDAWK